MNYQESVERSAEIMRLAIALMAKQAAAFHPVSYAVWYEYVAGTNAALRAEIDVLTKDGRHLDEEATRTLYRRHLADLDEETAKRVTEGFRRILSDVSRSAAEAGSEASRFGEALGSWRDHLAVKGASTDSDVHLVRVLRSTSDMGGAIGTLQARLAETRDETERLRREVERARQEALTDSLTGIFNRKGFDQALAACLATVSNSAPGPSLLMADIDHFKKVNDTHGHLFGDRVIRAVGQVLKAGVNGAGIAGRYGGEEFVLLLPGIGIDEACAMAESVRTTVASSRIRRADREDVVGSVTISIGVASHRPGESPAALIERADRALYAAKAQGRNRSVTADSALA